VGDAGGGGGAWAAHCEAGPGRGGGWATRGGGGGNPRLAGPQGEGEKREERKKGFPLLIYFLDACFTTSLNKQNRCMVWHGATTKRFNPRVLLKQDVELILARTLKKNKA
jgi:hypothetical protein